MLNMIKTKNQTQIAIVGGGFFGLYIAWYLARKGNIVTIFEKEQDLMTHASYHNQARVHNGYHYPRSVLTALRSRVSFPRFNQDFPNCVYKSFDKYYGIGKFLGKVTSYQFHKFCNRIGAYIEPAPSKVRNLVNSQFIEDLYTVQEYAFNSTALKEEMLSRIADLPITINLNSEVNLLKKDPNDHRIILLYNNSTKQNTNSLSLNEASNINISTTSVAQEQSFDHVFNCTYSRINLLTTNSNLELVPLKQEMTEMCLCEVPDELKNLGITIMCGPFFSVMPFPSVVHNERVVHSLSHVRYTPHYEWYDSKENYQDPYQRLNSDLKNTAWPLMLKDASRYIPCLQESKYLKSLWEVKTVLPRSEIDDSRPILCLFNHGMKGFHCCMGGKIDNVYDAVEAISKELGL